MSDGVQTETPPVTDWRSGIAEEHQSAVSGFVQDGNLNVSSLAKGYSELYSKMGNSVKIPTADSSEESVRGAMKVIC